MTLLFKMAVKHSAEVLFSVPKYNKAVMCLKLHSGMNHSAIV